MIVDNISIGFQKMHLLKSYLVWLPDIEKDFVTIWTKIQWKEMEYNGQRQNTEGNLSTFLLSAEDVEILIYLIRSSNILNGRWTKMSGTRSVTLG